MSSSVETLLETFLAVVETELLGTVEVLFDVKPDDSVVEVVEGVCTLATEVVE